MKCEKHNIHWEMSDPLGCPVCYGISTTIESIKDWAYLHLDLTNSPTVSFLIDDFEAFIASLQKDTK